MSQQTKWVFGILITILVVLVAVGSYLVVSGRIKIGAAGETESCLQVVPAVSTSNLTAEAGSYLNVWVGRTKSCSQQNTYGLIEIADPTVASIESAVPSANSGFGTTLETTGLFSRIRLLKAGSTTVSVKLVERASQSPLQFTITATTPAATAVFASPEWTPVVDTVSSTINLSGGTAPYLYRSTKYMTPTGAGQWTTTDTGYQNYLALEDTSHAKVEVKGKQLVVTGKAETVQMYGEVKDSAGKIASVRFTVFPNAKTTTAAVSNIAIGQDMVQTVASNIGAMSISNALSTSLWKIESTASTGAPSTLYYRGLSSGASKAYIAGGSANPQGTGADYWKDLPVTVYGANVSGTVVGKCDTGEVAYPVTSSAWNLMTMPVTKSNATKLSTLLGLDTSNLNSWAYRGLGKDYEKTDTFKASEGYWLNTSAQNVCMSQSDLSSTGTVTLPYSRVNILPNPFGDVKASKVKIKFGTGKQYTLAEALKNPLESGVQALIVYSPENTTNVQGKYIIYKMYYSQNQYPELKKSDSYNTSWHDVSELPTSFPALKAIGWLVTSSSKGQPIISYSK